MRIATLSDRINWASPQAAGLVAFWPLNDGGGKSPRDLRSSVPVSSVTNSPLFLRDSIHVNHTATNSYVNTGFTARFTQSYYSVSFWFCPTLALANYASAQICSHFSTADGWRGWLFRQSNASIAAYLRYNVASEALMTSSGLCKQGVWSHVALVCTPGVCYSLYQDGVLRATTPIVNFNFTETSQVQIGLLVYDGWGKFFGKVADLRLYRQPLTADAVLNLYTNPMGVYLPSLRAPPIRVYVPRIWWQDRAITAGYVSGHQISTIQSAGQVLWP